VNQWSNNRIHTNRRQAFQFGYDRCLERWIRSQRKILAAVGVILAVRRQFKPRHVMMNGGSK
jgi:hypothetical protein